MARGLALVPGVASPGQLSRGIMLLTMGRCRKAWGAAWWPLLRNPLTIKTAPSEAL